MVNSLLISARGPQKLRIKVVEHLGLVVNKCAQPKTTVA